MFVNGRWYKTDSQIDVRSPATGELVDCVYKGGKKETEEAIDAAYQAFSKWSQLPAIERANYLERVAAKILEKRDFLAQVITKEMGKSIHNARYEVDSTAAYFKWFAEEARRVYGEIVPASHTNKRIMVIKQPIGVIGAITSWNFPLQLPARKIATALAAGCTVVLRPSTQAPISAVELFRILEECEIPSGAVNLVIGNADEISQVILQNDKVRKLTFTGSTEVGKELIKGSAETVKKVSMELGGHAPFIVFEDANLEEAVEGAISIKFNSSGQQCVCANRIYVHDSIYDQFETVFTKKVAELKVGNGLDETCRIGPLINEESIRKIQSQVNDAVDKGAKILFGGHQLTDGEYSQGLFYAPTVLSNVDESMVIYAEETFGPVAPLIRFHTEEEVIQSANNTNYGLSSYVYTSNLSRIYRVMEKLEYGMVGVNDAAPFVVQAPFGGIKESGMGSEGGHGIEEFLETKFISIKI